MSQSDITASQIRQCLLRDIGIVISDDHIADRFNDSSTIMNRYDITLSMDFNHLYDPVNRVMVDIVPIWSRHLFLCNDHPVNVGQLKLDTMVNLTTELIADDNQHPVLSLPDLNINQLHQLLVAKLAEQITTAKNEADRIITEAHRQARAIVNGDDKIEEPLQGEN